MFFPNCGQRMSAVPARLLTYRNQNKSATLYSFDLPFGNTQLGRIDLIVRGVDCQHRCADVLEFWRGIIIARSVERIQHVVSVGAAQLTADQIIEKAIGCFARRGLLLPLKW